MKKDKTKQYNIKYRILDEPGIKNLYGSISALSVISASDFAEKMLINDGLAFSSFEIVEVEEVSLLSTAQQQFKLKSYREQRKALAEMIADDGAHYSNVCEIWKAFGSIMLATEDAKIEEQIASGNAKRVTRKVKRLSLAGRKQLVAEWKD